MGSVRGNVAQPIAHLGTSGRSSRLLGAFRRSHVRRGARSVPNRMLTRTCDGFPS